MSAILKELITISAELRSERVQTRHRAIERLNDVLSNLKSDFTSGMGNYGEKRIDNSITWTELMASAMNATFKQAEKIEEASDAKSCQTLRNKNYAYNSVITKIIDYNLEKDNKLLSKSAIFDAFVEGIQRRIVVRHFGNLLLYLLERGIYKSLNYVRDLQVNEFSRILSYLFELNTDNDISLKFAVLKAIIKSIELAVQNVQLSIDLVDYLPEIRDYAKYAREDSQKADIIKLFRLLITELSVDYHHIVCIEVQELLPILCGFYSYHMKVEAKDHFFESSYLVLVAIYPFLHKGDINTIAVTLDHKWTKTMKKLKTIVEVEIKEQSENLRFRSLEEEQNRRMGPFTKFASAVMYLVFWHVDVIGNSETFIAHRSKVQKTADKLEQILQILMGNEPSSTGIWFAILSEIISVQEDVLKPGNIKDLLSVVNRIMKIHINVNNMKNVRRCIETLLRFEVDLAQRKIIPFNYCYEEWIKIVEYILSDLTHHKETIPDSLLVLQDLMKYEKLSQSHCTDLMKLLLGNISQKTSECVQTIRQILLQNEDYSIVKSPDLVTSLFSWCYDFSDKNNARSILLNFSPVHPCLLADTCAIAVINFLKEKPKLATFEEKNTYSSCDRLLLYRFNMSWVCQDPYITQSAGKSEIVSSMTQTKKYNCIIESNYDSLMRTLNYSASKNTSCKDILSDLPQLHKMACVLKAFTDYDIFDEFNLYQCPLVKRIGFFLSHMELQLKNNEAKNIERSDLYDILQELESICEIFLSNKTLLSYFEQQPLEELINFLGAAIKMHDVDKFCTNFEEIPCTGQISARTLARICASTSHCRDAFTHLSTHRINMKTNLDHFLNIVQIMCAHGNVVENIALWLVDILKTVFPIYYLNIEIVDRIIKLLPGILMYVQQFEDALYDMLIAVNSLLKVAYKKSYPTSVIVNLIDSIRLICHQCRGICIQEDFTNICLSVVKFLPFPSIQIQFSAINTIGHLMDINWVCCTMASAEEEKYFKFCKELYSQVDLRLLPTETVDQLQICKSVTIQMLITLFAFSLYHKENSFEQLILFCDEKKLTEGDVFLINSVAKFHGTSLSGMMEPYVTHSIHYWISSHHSIMKYPFFLFGKSKKDFISDNLATIVTCYLLYRSKEPFIDLQLLKTPEELIQISLPQIIAFYLVLDVQCHKTTLPDNQRYMESLCGTLKSFDIDLNKREKIENWLSAETLSSLVSLIVDSDFFSVIFDFSMHYESTKWYHLTHDSLKECVDLYLNGTISSRNKDLCLIDTIIHSPLMVVRVLNQLKMNCADCLFRKEKLHYFYTYCVLADMVMDSLSASNITKNITLYMWRDILFFTLHMLQAVDAVELQLAITAFLRRFVKKSVLTQGVCREFLAKYLNDICKVLVSFIEHCKSSVLKEQCLDVIHMTIIENQSILSDSIPLLDEFPSDSIYKDFHEIWQGLQPPNRRSPNSIVTIKSFLNTQNRYTASIINIQEHIRGNLRKLQEEYPEMLYELVKCFIQLVRDSKSVECQLAACKCLGIIGATKIKGMAYYFPKEMFAYPEEANECLNIVTIFLRSIMNPIEHLLVTFRSKTQKLVYNVCELVLNSASGNSFYEEYPQLAIFRSSGKKRDNYLDHFSNTNKLDWMEIFKSTESLTEYDKWICVFTSKVFEHSEWWDFGKLSLQDNFFADAALQPFLKLLMNYKEIYLNDLIILLEYFFLQFSVSLKKSQSELQVHNIFQEKLIIKKFLDICECIRLNNRWTVPINLLYVAQASNYCQAYFMSILYLELWALNNNNSATNGVEKTNMELMANEIFQETASEAYQSIGCSDAILGFLNPMTSRLKYFCLENNCADVLLEVSASDIPPNDIYISSLKRNGMFALINHNRKTIELDYEVCWRLCQWETPVEGTSKVNSLNDMEKEFEKNHFRAMKFMYKREENNCLDAITKGRQCIIAMLEKTSVECLQCVYKYATWLQLLQQIEDFCQIQFGSACSVEQIFNHWKDLADMEFGNFRCKEQLLSHQISVFSTAGIRASRKIKDFYQMDPIHICLLKSIKECKKAGEFNLAKQKIISLKSMDVDDPQIKVTILLEDADLCWQSGKPQMTETILHHVIHNKEFSLCLQRIRAFRMLGDYLMESNSESFETVVHKYFNGSITLLNKFIQEKDRILHKYPNAFQLDNITEFADNTNKSVFETIAKYSDQKYTQLHTYIMSDEFEMRRRIMQENRQAAENVGKANRDRDKHHGASIMKKFANIDEEELKCFEQNRSINLCMAVKYYIKFCTIDDTISSPAIYRVIALWFSNKSNTNVHETVRELLLNVPSYKFICALSQMTARLNAEDRNFLSVLTNLLIQCARDHPQQTLLQLFTLVFAFHDKTESMHPNNRVNVAKNIIAKCRNSANSDTIDQMEKLFPILINFANKDVGDKKNSVVSISENLKNLKNLYAIHCLTMNLEVSPSKNYEITSIQKWDEHVTLVGGVNIPKKLSCICSDGTVRPQLLKGRDDLRQDAVMQQVFVIINNLFHNEPETVGQKLRIRTYKIVPLSMRCGILEWCQNTIPIGGYLIGSNKDGAHQKYRPEDFSAEKCRKLSMTHLKSGFDKRFQIYLHICKNIQPVFHYFFFEHFHAPGVWFERRLAYTNSVATTSIVGYILGLGDRHTQNILIDKKTGEVIHIDFGIAFEQGQIMPTPETVPFRLTRDVVAPMGVCEVHGLFKKSCEVTMRILRNNRSVISTILEVLLHDPLYIWKVVPESLISNSSIKSEKTNFTAQRALLRVQNKLEGKEPGILGTADVGVQVQRLISEATAPRNLSQLYPGWDPYL